MYMCFSSAVPIFSGQELVAQFAWSLKQSSKNYMLQVFMSISTSCEFSRALFLICVFCPFFDVLTFVIILYFVFLLSLRILYCFFFFPDDSHKGVERDGKGNGRN